MSTFTAALRRAADGDRGMVTGEPGAPVRRTWRQIHESARTAAGRMAAAGVRPGDAVAVLAAQPADVAPVAQAAWLAGASVTMLHQPTARTDMAHYLPETAAVLRVIRARAVVLGPPFDGPQFTAAAEQLRALGVLVLTGAELTAPGDVPAPDVEVGEDATALLQLTSGSTATPKAVRISHGNVWANLESMCAAAAIGPGDVMVSWLPLFHDMGMVGFLTLPMSRGIEVVAVTPSDFLSSPLLWPQLISRYGGSVTAAPNFAYALTARVLARAAREAEKSGQETGLDLSTLRFALNGAEPVDVDAVQAFLTAGAAFGLPSTAMVPAYGMAEATLGVSFHPWGTPLEVDTVDGRALEHDLRAVPVSDPNGPAGAGSDAVVGSGEGQGAATARRYPVLGPPLPGVQVRVCGPDGPGGPDRAEREVGTLFLRGPAVTDTYFTVDGPIPTRDADGWLDTGDLGYLVDGRIVICGRVKDVIIMGGRNIYPTDIERVAEAVEGVRAGNAVAVRWSTPGGRESFAVAVESRAAGGSGSEQDAEQVQSAVRSAVTTAVGVRPALVRVLPPGTLPKTPSGKIKRTAAAALLADGA